MEVLGFILMTVVILGLIAFNTAMMDKIDAYTIKTFGYKYFSFQNFVYGGFGWLLLVCGFFWKLDEGGLNALVLMATGGFFILTQFINNVRKTSFLTALLLLPYQSLVYALGSFMSILAVLLLLSFVTDKE